MPPNSRPERASTRSSLLALSGVIVLLVALYLGYDLLKPVISPCESIFEQTSVSMDTNLDILKNKGEVFIGRRQVQELGERAQMAALQLKTCCTVLGAGDVNSEQFLECQQGANKLQAEVAALVGMVDKAEAARDAGDEAAAEQEIARIQQSLELARRDAERLRETVNQVARQPRGGAVVPTQPETASSTNVEIEPNSDILQPNVIPPDTWVEAEIADASDEDFFKFSVPPKYRDRVRIEVENRSTTWAPWYRLLNDKKAKLEDHGSGTPGADVVNEFSTEPAAQYHLRVGKYHDTAGAYRVRVTPLRSYDGFEPNDGILDATTVSVGVPTEAEIMDRADEDFFVFTTGPSATSAVVTIENRSTTLAPWFRLLDGNKSKIVDAGNGTPGGDASEQIDVAANSRYYVRVGKYHDSSGAYALTVRVE